MVTLSTSLNCILETDPDQTSGQQCDPRVRLLSDSFFPKQLKIDLIVYSSKPMRTMEVESYDV